MMTISTYKQVNNLPTKINKVVVVMGATGTGKSRLAIDLAGIFSGEVINSDKIQVYKGLDVITNKVTDEERRGIPHHLLGIIDHPDEDFTAEDFVRRASLSVGDIIERGRLPIIAGGSNSFIEALVDNQVFRSKYECCFFWVDVSMPVLHSVARKRVDHMVGNGLVAEAREFSGGDYSRGIRRAIGVSEMDEFFKTEQFVDGVTRAELLKTAIDEIKENSCKLIHRQLEKIFMMGEKLKWRGMHHLDATEAFLRRDEDAAVEAWQRSVVGPSARILSEFLGARPARAEKNY
ncbi:Adenylate isopentenyltransferase 5, chloroplastic [Orobanche hederae]